MIPTLETDRLALRPFTVADAGRVQELAGDIRVSATALNIPHPYEDGIAESWISSHQENWKNRVALSLAVDSHEHGLIGSISLRLTPRHRRGELGYWIGVPYWNSGFASEAAEAIVAYGFESIELLRIEATYFVDNPASGRVLEKLGFVIEGRLRQYVSKDGSQKDLILCSRLATDQTR